MSVSFTAVEFNGSGWGATYTSTTSVNVNDTSTDVIFQPTNMSGVSNPAPHAIKWQPSTNTWADHGSDYPTDIVSGATVTDFTNPHTVSVGYGTNVLYTFVHPAGLPYTSTVTHGFSYSGTLTVNGTSLEHEIPATSSSGTYELKADGIIQLSIVHGSTASTGSAPNFDQTKIWTLISPMGDELDVINLTGSGASSMKKVFCNFW